MAKYLYDESVMITRSDGTKKRIRVRGNDEAEVKEKIALIKLKHKAGLITFNSNTPFYRWAEEWLDVYKKPNIEKGTYSEIKGILDRFFIPYIGNMNIGDIRLPHIQNCLNELEGYSKSYVRRAQLYIKACFQTAWEAEMINRSPCIGLKPPKTAQKIDRRPLTDEELRYFMEAIQVHHKGAFFGILYACGLRPGEARALIWDNINIEKKTLSVTQAFAEKTNELKPPKTEAGKRTIPIPDWYMDILKSIPRNESPYVFQTAKGNPLDSKRYNLVWKTLLREMEIKAGAELYRNKIIKPSGIIGNDLTAYNLRHTYATELVKKGVDIKTAQYLLGHSDIRVTMNIYAHVTDTMIETAREKINA
jgi:integrase